MCIWCYIVCMWLFLYPQDSILTRIYGMQINYNYNYNLFSLSVSQLELKSVISPDRQGPYATSLGLPLFIGSLLIHTRILELAAVWGRGKLHCNWTQRHSFERSGLPTWINISKVYLRTWSVLAMTYTARVETWSGAKLSLLMRAVFQSSGSLQGRAIVINITRNVLLVST